MHARIIAIAAALLWLAAPVAFAQDAPEAAEAGASAPQPSPEPGEALEPDTVEADVDADLEAALEADGETQPAAPSNAQPGSAPSEAAAPASDDALADGEPAGEAAPGAATGADESQAAADAPAPAAAPAPARQVVLGEVGYDENGQAGRIHVVVPGDTLWDISDAYLGTPWVWPSIWKDNRKIENPHLIYPGDRIWITPSEMRRVTPAEAERLLSGTPADDGLADDLAELPAALEQEDSGPTAVPVPAPVVKETGRTLRVPEIEMAGLVATEVLESAASVVDSPKDRVFLGGGDTIFLGLGKGEVEVGDDFTIVRKVEKVADVETGGDLGWYVATLGWARVTQVHPETAEATIRMSVDTIERGDPVLPRDKRDRDLLLKAAPPGVEGRIVFMPQHRLYMGMADLVFLNRGSIHGLEVGTELEVYKTGAVREDRVRHTEVQVPDEVVAQLVVVDVDPETATAKVVSSEQEITIGDRFRPRTADVASR